MSLSVLIKNFKILSFPNYTFFKNPGKIQIIKPIITKLIQTDHIIIKINITLLICNFAKPYTEHITVGNQFSCELGTVKTIQFRGKFKSRF